MKVGLTHTFQWYDVPNAKLELSRNGGAFELISSSVVTPQPSYPDLWLCSYTWAVTGSASSSNNVLRVTDNDDSTYIDYLVEDIELITVSGSSQSQRATSTGAVGNVVIVYGDSQSGRPTSTGVISEEIQQSSNWAGTVSYPKLNVQLDVTIVQGDDYSASDSRSIDFTYTGLPTIAGATVSFKVEKLGAQGTFTKSMSIVSSGGASQIVRAELTSAETSDFPVGTNWYDVQIALASGRVITPTNRSKLIVRADV